MRYNHQNIFIHQEYLFERNHIFSLEAIVPNFFQTYNSPDILSEETIYLFKNDDCVGGWK